jgi:hypothetical protein
MNANSESDSESSQVIWGQEKKTGPRCLDDSPASKKQKLQDDSATESDDNGTGIEIRYLLHSMLIPVTVIDRDNQTSTTESEDDDTPSVRVVSSRPVADGKFPLAHRLLTADHLSGWLHLNNVLVQLSLTTPKAHEYLPLLTRICETINVMEYIFFGTNIKRIEVACSVTIWDLYVA